jgi:hypothetical protein
MKRALASDHNFELDFNDCRTNSAVMLVLETPYISGNVFCSI